jgi:hypothetical protein
MGATLALTRSMSSLPERPAVSQLPTEAPSVEQEHRRVRAEVALVLLETLKSQDLPGEILDDEDVTLTIPRRLGLSGVVETQIQRYRQEARKGARVSEAEIRDLLRLVIRRPDSEDVFVRVGRTLTAATGAPRWRRVMPRPLVFALARRRVQRRLKVLFGGDVVRAAGVPFILDSVHELLIEADPGGEACGVVAGLAQSVLDAYGLKAEVRHVECRGRRDPRCRWEADSRAKKRPEKES